MTQNQVDYLTDTSLTDTIETYNTITSPLTVGYFKKIKGNNWYIRQLGNNLLGEPSYFSKDNLVENDNLLIRVEPINELRYKTITNITVKFRVEYYNHSAVPKVDNIKAILFDKEYSVYFDKYIKSGENNVFNCELFGVTSADIYNALQALEFYIDINFNGNRSNCNITIKDFKIDISFTNKLETEKKAIYSRLEEYFDNYDEYIDLYSDFLFNKDTKIVDFSDSGSEIKPYLVFVDDTIKVKLCYKHDKNSETYYPLVDENVHWFISEERHNDKWVNYKDYGYTNTSSQSGNEGVAELKGYIAKDEAFNLGKFGVVVLYEGNKWNDENDEYSKYSQIKKSRLDFDMIVGKFTPTVEISPNSNNYIVNQHLDGSKTYSQMIINFNTNIPEDCPTTIKCVLMNGNTELANTTLTKTNFSKSGYFIYDNYPTNCNKVKIITEENKYAKESTTIANINISSNVDYNIRSYYAELCSSDNYSGDRLYFRVRCNQGGELPIGEQLTITVGGISQNVTINNDGYALFTNTGGFGYSLQTWQVKYNGRDDVNNSVRHNSFVSNGNVNIYVYEWSAWHSFKNYYGVSWNGTDYNVDNTNSGKWKKWSTLGDTSICSKIGAAGTDGRQPRRLKITGFDNPFTGNVSVRSAELTFKDMCYSDSSGVAPQIRTNDDWCWFYLGTNDKRGVAHKVKEDTWGEHNFARNGSWNLNQVNATYVLIAYNENTGSKSGTITLGGKKRTIEIKYAGLKVTGVKMRILYRRNQNIWR
ncbi:hypothetical protein J6W34_04950 [bacterium]|nr:hypothetical protein [bacterium]